MISIIYMHVYENIKIFSVFELIDDLCDLCDHCFKVEHFSQSMVGRFTKKNLRCEYTNGKVFYGQDGVPFIPGEL